VLERASGSLPNYPGDPPAAAGGLGSAGTRSHSGPSEAARLRRTAAACSKRYDPLFRHDVKGADGLGSPGYQTGTVRASTGRVWTGDVAELRGPLGDREISHRGYRYVAGAVRGPGARLAWAGRLDIPGRGILNTNSPEAKQQNKSRVSRNMVLAHRHRLLPVSPYTRLT
jgi:hypothetical protein